MLNGSLFNTSTIAFADKLRDLGIWRFYINASF